ncbi:septum formation initiator family protein [Bacteroides sp. 519]|uniref:FtsB family cell division protein n=1 Tax=Bacteroides sp. 519 TaxID=2302937 RepID=UPI0013D0F11A|nr:septum formation initiator family protein [Bacteroides sp. 519]NDV60590.1 septum formation initiator family protein [Bacteroides sp. 519]
MDKIKPFLKIVSKYKCTITLIVFGIYIGFIDQNSLVRRMQYASEIHDLNKEIEKYQAEYDESTQKLQELTTNPEAIERIAREKYLMKKPNEDIYIIE